MNSKLYVPPTFSTSSQMNHSNSLTDQKSYTGISSNRFPPILLPPNVQTVFPRNTNNLLVTLNSPILPVNNPPARSIQQQNTASLPVTSSLLVLKPNSPNVTVSSGVNNHSPTPSPPSQNNLLSNEAIKTSPNTTPSPSSQMNSMVNSSNLPAISTPSMSDTQPLTLLIDSIQSPPNPYAYFAPLYGDLFENNDHYTTQNPKDPPPYSTAILNNQSEATYTTLSSVPPLHHYESSTSHDIPSTSSGLEQNAFSYMQSCQGFDDRMSDLPPLTSSDDGIGTSIESAGTSRDTSPGLPSQNSPVMVNGEDSMTGGCCTSMPNQPHFEPQPIQAPPRPPLCETCGSYLIYRNGRYDCNACEATRASRMGKRKKKTGQNASNRKNEKTSCSNCETENTSLWRRDTNGLSLCNACGLYLKLHNKHRPKSMRKDTIQRRIRKPRNNEVKSEKKDPQSPPGDACPAFPTINTPAITYSVPSTSNSIQPTIYYAQPSTSTGSSTSQQIPSFHNVHPTYMIQNTAFIGENSDQNNYTHYSMMEL